MSDIHDDSRKWFESKLKGASLEKMVAAGKRNQSRNSAYYGKESKYVSHMGERVLSNPEYVARLVETKKLREQLKTYTGSPEYASDLLFEAKKDADSMGADWTFMCQKVGYEMMGNHLTYVVKNTTNEVIKPKKPLASRILHQLWKMGFPVARFIKKELSVNEANGVTE
jgi:hypothetical protein